jgi:hypothetical protein
MEAPATKTAAEIAMMETTRKWRPCIAKIIAGLQAAEQGVCTLYGMLK